MNLSTGVSSFTVHSGSDVTPTLHAAYTLNYDILAGDIITDMTLQSA